MIRIKLPSDWVDIFYGVRKFTALGEVKSGLRPEKINIVSQYAATLVMESEDVIFDFPLHTGESIKLKFPVSLPYLHFEHEDEAALFKLTYM
jgi:hypothetical protein